MLSGARSSRSSPSSAAHCTRAHICFGFPGSGDAPHPAPCTPLLAADRRAYQIVSNEGLLKLYQSIEGLLKLYPLTSRIDPPGRFQGFRFPSFGYLTLFVFSGQKTVGFKHGVSVSANAL